MRSTLITLLVLAGFSVNAQNVLKVSTGATLKTTGGVTIVLQDMNLENDGTINQASGDGGFKFTGTQTSNIGGTSMPVFGILEINKTNGGKVLLNRNVSINSSINFITGQLDLNSSNILMATGANIAGESETTRIVGPNGGFVEINQSMNAPASVNPGNLGATISSSANLGTVIIRRGHMPQSGAGLSTGIYRYYSIIPENNNSLNATLRLRYFESELNSQDENSLVIYQSNDDGINWNNMSQSTRNTNANYVEKSGLATLTLQTLANDNTVNPDGATGVVLTGQRKKTTDVTLKWTSQTETNMSGYQIQRRLKNESDFTDRDFVTTIAPGGNSMSPLSYQNIDPNSYTDTSYYRLKLVTTNATFTYSNVIAVPAKTKGSGGGNGNGNNKTTEDITTVNSKPLMQTGSLTKKITVGPNPNNGNFWFSVSGIENGTIAALFTVDGKLLKQFTVVNLRQQQVSGIRTGIYLLKVPGFETQKIIVNGGGSHVPAAHPENNLKL